MFKSFYDITLQAGSLRSTRRHDIASLSPAAVEVFRDMLERHGSAFREPIPVRGLEHLELQWTGESPSAALATFWSRGELTTSSALLSGRDPRAEAEIASAFQTMVMRAFRDTPLEPGFAMESIAERPLIATLPWPNPRVRPDDMMLIADMETCLAAAFFGGEGSSP